MNTSEALYGNILRPPLARQMTIERVDIELHHSGVHLLIPESGPKRGHSFAFTSLRSLLEFLELHESRAVHPMQEVAGHLRTSVPNHDRPLPEVRLCAPQAEIDRRSPKILRLDLSRLRPLARGPRIPPRQSLRCPATSCIEWTARAAPEIQASVT